MEAPEQQEAFQAVYIPKQTQPKPAHLQQGTMRVNVVSYPPLGQVTVVKTGKPATFNVLLEVDESRASDEWHVAVWFSSDDEWRQVDLKPAALTITSFDQPHEHDSVHLQFSGELPQQSITNFTIKFRSGSDWKWVRDNQGAQDGTIISRPTFEAQDLTDLVGDLNPAFQWSQVLSETPKTSVWSVTTSIDGADGIHSAFKTVKFGRPWKGDFLRWFALVRIWTPWLCPRQGRSHFQLDKDAVMCSFLNKQGQHLVVYAISGVEDVLTIIESDDVGGISLNIRNDRETQGKARIVVALGNEFELANAAAMYHARSIVMDLGKDNQQYEEEMKAIDEGVRVQWMENWFDGLTYCKCTTTKDARLILSGTWNGLGQRLTEEKVYKAVDILAQHKINITNLIIDDNWQDLDYRGEGQFQHGWSSFEADPETFPDGLRALTSNIRMKHPNIQHIAVWHALWGYWGGIDPTGKLAKEYKTVEAVRVDGKRRNLPLGGKVTLIAKEDVPKFYDDFYRFLSNSGVDAVKTDAQFMFDTLRDATDRRDLFNTYLDAWTVSSLKHFSIKAISCMSQTPQILYHSQLPSNRPAILVRNSDDFFPEVPSSHTWHVWTNAHNALMTQHLNLLPDWDMFQTVHDYSGFHAAARCVSGGPIYITDVPGQHDMNLIKQMTGRTTRGKTVIFRPSVVGKSLDQYIDYNDEVLLKIATYHGTYHIFNLQRPVPLT